MPPQQRDEPEPEPEPEPEALQALDGWERTGVGGGQLRWIECRRGSGRRRGGGSGANNSGGKRGIATLTQLASAAPLALAAQQLMDEANARCPLLPIHTTRASPPSGGPAAPGAHELLPLRKAGRDDLPAAAAEALRLSQDALHNLRRACELDPPLASQPAVAKTLRSWQAQAARFQAQTTAPAPRPFRDFREEWRAEAAIPYCTRAHRLREAVVELVRLGWAEDQPAAGFALEKLHTLPTAGRAVPACPAVLAAFKHAGASVPKDWGQWWVPGKRGRQRHIKAFRATPQYAAFCQAFRRFVADVVAPLLNDPRGVVFQCPPTLRVVLPSERATGKPHVDSDYPGHEQAEVNFW